MGQPFTIPRTSLGDTAQFIKIIEGEHSAIEVNDSAPTLLVGNVPERTQVIIQNYSDATESVFLGIGNNGANVTATNDVDRGIELIPGAGFIFDALSTIQIYAITPTATFRISVTEAL